MATRVITVQNTAFSCRGFIIAPSQPVEALSNLPEPRPHPGWDRRGRSRRQIRHPGKSPVCKPSPSVLSFVHDARVRHFASFRICLATHVGARQPGLRFPAAGLRRDVALFGTVMPLSPCTRVTVDARPFQRRPRIRVATRTTF